jgi:hypothetical protein
MYQIRKCERYTSWQTTEVANLDPEKFRTLSIPFEGETEEEFLDYIESNRYELEEIYEEFDEETLSELGKIWEPEWSEYSNSAWKYEDSWHESGRADETWTKTGGFESYHTTDRGY